MRLCCKAGLGARLDFTELGDKGTEQGGVACLPERVYAQLAEYVVLRRFFPAWCYEGRCCSRVLGLKTVLVRPIMGADELGSCQRVQRERAGGVPGQGRIFYENRVTAIGLCLVLRGVSGRDGWVEIRTAGVFCLIEDVVEVLLVASEGGGEAGETGTCAGECADQHGEWERVIR